MPDSTPATSILENDSVGVDDMEDISLNSCTDDSNEEGLTPDGTVDKDRTLICTDTIVKSLASPVVHTVSESLVEQVVETEITMTDVEDSEIDLEKSSTRYTSNADAYNSLIDGNSTTKVSKKEAKREAKEMQNIVWKRTPLTATWRELLRDRLLVVLDKSFLSTVAVVVWMILVIIVGALFFFLLVGAFTIGDENANKEWLNYSIQALNVLFSYTAVFSIVWRVANLVHLSTPSRSSERGMDFYGQPTTKIWFHLSRNRRLFISWMLVCNCVTQYINQIMRIIYFSVEDSENMPGIVLVNLFFALSFICGIIAGIAQLVGAAKLRSAHPHLYQSSGLTDPVDKLYYVYSEIVYKIDYGSRSTTNIHDIEGTKKRCNGMTARESDAEE
eukprot:CFRG2069T1